MSSDSVEQNQIKRTFTRAELEELDVPYAYETDEHVVHTEQVGTKRWATIHHAIFRTEKDGPLWRVTYYEGATEEQECDLWGYGYEPETVEAVQVEPHMVEVIRYRPVSVAS